LGRFPFLKKKGTGLEFILSNAEGLQSFLKQEKYFRGIYPELVEGIPNATS
jgi:hypothetical protein